MNPQHDPYGCDGLKESINQAIYSLKSSFAQLKQEYDEYDDQFKTKTAEYFESVEDYANKAVDKLQDFATLYPPISDKTLQSYNDSVRDAVTKWNDGLHALEERASDYDSKFGDQVKKYAAMQRQQMDNIVHKLQGEADHYKETQEGE
ncbi:hypothetical protein AC1031_000246 [Aphanomyces cochlioides]|nr:hypothetical protein AC1031_000246 [Aphanomyces cochlioides]